MQENYDLQIEVTSLQLKHLEAVATLSVHNNKILLN